MLIEGSQGSYLRIFFMFQKKEPTMRRMILLTLRLMRDAFGLLGNID
jgi:hypothetical protein